MKNKKRLAMNKCCNYLVFIVLLLSYFPFSFFNYSMINAQDIQSSEQVSKLIDIKQDSITVNISKLNIYQSFVQEIESNEKLNIDQLIERNLPQAFLEKVQQIQAEMDCYSLDSVNQSLAKELDEVSLEIQFFISIPHQEKSESYQYQGNETVYVVLMNHSDESRKVQFVLDDDQLGTAIDLGPAIKMIANTTDNTENRLNQETDSSPNQTTLSTSTSQDSSVAASSFTSYKEFMLSTLINQKYSEQFDGFKVIAYTSQLSFSEKVHLKVSQVAWDNASNSQQQLAQHQKLVLNKQGINEKNAVILNLRFENNQNEEVEPRYVTEVHLQIDGALLRERQVNPATLSIIHMKEGNKNTGEDDQAEVVAAANDNEKMKAVQYNGVTTVDEGIDMTNPIKPTLKSTVNQVMAQFKVDSFSNYVISWEDSTGLARAASGVTSNLKITWEGSSYHILHVVYQVLTLDNQLVNLYGSEVSKVNSRAQFKTLTSDDYYNISIPEICGIPAGYDYVKSYYMDNGTSYTFNQMYIRSYALQSYIFYNNQREVKETVRRAIWEKAEETIYVVLKEHKRADTIETEDTSDFLEMSLFDYSSAINTNHSLKFNYGGYNNGANGINDYMGNSARVNQAIVTRNLDESGNPVLMYGYGSLDYLFPNAANASQGIPFVKTGLNHLFKKDTEGNLLYDSSQNFATLNRGSLTNFDPNSTTNDFVVYDKPLTYVSGANPKTARFQPLSDMNMYGDLMTPRNLWFGMKMAATVLQPIDGKVLAADGTTKKDMMLEFSGEDDIWVYIDGKKILDLGGIHETVFGSINFATGVIHIDATNQEGKAITDTTIAKQVRLAEKELNPNLTDAKINEQYQFNGETFANNTTHQIKIFFFERGDGESNIRMKMNFNMLPLKNICLGKSVESSNTEVSINGDSAYDFLIEHKIDGSYEPYSGSYDLYEGQKIQLANARKLNSTSLKMENDRVSLKANQFIVITPSDESELFKMTELVDVADEPAGFQDLYAVKTNLQSDTLSPQTLELNGNHYQAYSQENISARTTPIVYFINKVQSDVLDKLVIEKQVVNAVQPISESFTIQLQLAGQAYRGQYLLYQEDTDTGELRSTTDGNISIQANQKIVIPNILWNTSYSIAEIVPAGYHPPQYQRRITWDTRTNSLEATNTVEVISSSVLTGVLPLEKNGVVKVKIINTVDIPVQEIPNTGQSFSQSAYIFMLVAMGIMGVCQGFIKFRKNK